MSHAPLRAAALALLLASTSALAAPAKAAQNAAAKVLPGEDGRNGGG